MQIRRIEIRDFRKLSHVVVEDLQDGLNVLVGDNEAGKSTLLAALRAALFERHRVGGDVAAGMQPYGQSVRPEISIDFDLDGKAWRLRKAFCQRQEAELVGRTAVRYALEGRSDVMVTLERMAADAYAIATGMAPLEVVANQQRRLPVEFVNETGNGLTPSFEAYARPLLGDPLPEFVRL